MRQCFFVLMVMIYTCLPIYAEEMNDETSMVVYVEDKEGNIIENTMFGIYDDKGKLISMKKSDCYGKLNFGGLSGGKYTIRLMESLAIYNMNKTEFTFYIKKNSQNVVHIRLEKKRDVKTRDIISQAIVWGIYLLGCIGCFSIYLKIK